MTWPCEEVVRHLGIEPEWTAAADDGVGFVSADLGVWLTVEDKELAAPALRAELRLARGVIDSAFTRDLLDALNHRGSLGRWVFDSESETVAVIAALGLASVVREAVVPVAAYVVSSMVAVADHLTYRSVPELDLTARKAIALLGGRRHPAGHPYIRQFLKRQLAGGEQPGAAQRVLPLVQDVLLNLTNGWPAQHGSTSSWSTDGEGHGLSVGVAKHPAMGYGLMIAARADGPEDTPRLEAAAQAFEFNRLVAGRTGLGAWTVGQRVLEYRIFLPNALIELVESDTPEVGLVSEAIREVVASVSSDLQPAKILVRPIWDGEEEAAVLARRDPINDGFEVDDGYTWLDTQGRAVATTEASYHLWRSRLTKADRDDPGVAGYSGWFEREVAHRHRQTPLAD